MSFTASKHEIKTIRQDDDNFHLNDGMVRYPRAMMHITPECPFAMRNAIESAYMLGYLKMVAHVQGKELTWEQLTK